jgi:hypothetical protein
MMVEAACMPAVVFMCMCMFMDRVHVVHGQHASWLAT